MNASLICYEVFVMDAGESVLALFIVVCLGLTLYLRKDLEEHGLRLWVYVGFPLLFIPALLLALSKELPQEIVQIVRPSLFLIGLFVIFISTLLAYFRRD